MDTPEAAITRAIEAVGGASELGRRLGVPWPSAVTNWVARGVPAERCLAIECATDGAVTRYELRPDVFGPAPAPRAGEAA